MSRMKRLKTSMTQFPDIPAPSMWLLAFEQRAVWEFWSGRELARELPDLVRQVITLGSPFTGHPLASTGTHLYEWLSGDRFEDLDFNRHLEMRIKPPVPTTSIYSKLDGVVSWQCSIEQEQPQGESINLRGHSHIGMASAPLALYLIADRLAQPQDGWKPFEPRGVARVFFGPRDHQSADK